jgi:hypothetical protein
VKPYRGFLFGGSRNDEWREDYSRMIYVPSPRPVQYDGLDPRYLDLAVTVQEDHYLWSRSLGKWCLVY